jgi:hypothetical protein
MHAKGTAAGRAHIKPYGLSLQRLPACPLACPPACPRLPCIRTPPTPRSLLNKLGIAPSTLVVACIGLAVVALIIAGVQMRFLLHAPLQLASVLFAASSTTEVCGRFFASNTSLGCMGAVSLMQLSLGVFIPGIMCHLLDMRGSPDKPYLPHVQAKRWLLQP